MIFNIEKCKKQNYIIYSAPAWRISDNNRIWQDPL